MNIETNFFFAFFLKILSPVVWVMDFVLSLYLQLLNSPGLAVIVLALTMTLVCWPLQKVGKRIEEGLSLKIAKINEELAPYKSKLKGEALFLKTEEVYKKHNYHPIKSAGLGMSFLIVLPILLSAIVLLSDHLAFVGKQFFFLADLSKPDAFFKSVNLLPFIMTGITIFDANRRFANDPQTKTRFLVIAVVLFFLVYNLPSALLLYWTTNVLISMIMGWKKAGAAVAEAC